VSREPRHGYSRQPAGAQPCHDLRDITLGNRITAIPRATRPDEFAIPARHIVSVVSEDHIGKRIVTVGVQPMKPARLTMLSVKCIAVQEAVIARRVQTCPSASGPKANDSTRRAQCLLPPTICESSDAGDDRSVDAEFATETLRIWCLISSQFRSWQRLFLEIGSGCMAQNCAILGAEIRRRVCT